MYIDGGDVCPRRSRARAKYRVNCAESHLQCGWLSFSCSLARTSHITNVHSLFEIYSSSCTLQQSTQLGVMTSDGSFVGTSWACAKPAILHMGSLHEFAVVMPKLEAASFSMDSKM